MRSVRAPSAARSSCCARRSARTTALGEPSEVHIDRRHGLTLLAVRPKVPLELGWGGFETKLARFGRVLALWKGREAELAGLRCLDDDEVIVRTRAVAPAVPAGREPRRPART